MINLAHAIKDAVQRQRKRESARQAQYDETERFYRQCLLVETQEHFIDAFGHDIAALLRVRYSVLDNGIMPRRGVVCFIINDQEYMLYEHGDTWVLRSASGQRYGAVPKPASGDREEAQDLFLIFLAAHVEVT